MIFDKLRKKSRETLPKSTTIVDKFHSESNEISNDIDTFSKLSEATYTLVSISRDELTDISIGMTVSKLYFERREDIPSDLFCVADKIGLLATYECHSHIGMYGSDKNDYYVQLTLKE